MIKLLAVSTVLLSASLDASIIRSIDFSEGESYTKDYTIVYGDSAGFHHIEAVTKTPDVLEVWSIDHNTGDRLDLLTTSGESSLNHVISGYLNEYEGASGVEFSMRKGSAWSAIIDEPAPAFFGSVDRDPRLTVFYPTAVSEPYTLGIALLSLATGLFLRKKLA